MQQWAEDTIRDMAWQWVSSHAGYIAGGIAIMLLAFMFISMILNVLSKHIPAMLICGGVLAIVAWKCLPRPEPVVVAKHTPPPARPIELPEVNIDLSKLKLPEITLPEITLPKFDLPSLDDLAELQRQAEEKRKEEEEERQRAEEEARRLARAEAARRRKMIIRANNAQAAAIMDAYIGQGLQQLQAQEAMRERMLREEGIRMITPPGLR